MNGQARIMVAVGIGAAGILLLVYASIQASARQYVRVHELVSGADAYDGKRVKLSGEIMEDSVTFDENDLTLQFRVKDVKGAEKNEGATGVSEATTEIVFQGPKPDAFKEGGVAIVKGVYDKEKNRIKATNLQAKCPSRYKKEFENGKKSTDQATSETEK